MDNSTWESQFGDNLVSGDYWMGFNLINLYERTSGESREFRFDLRAVGKQGVHAVYIDLSFTGDERTLTYSSFHETESDTGK